MVEFLAAVAIAFSGRPVTVHCPIRWDSPAAAAYVVYPTVGGGMSHLWMPRRTCRNLRTRVPFSENIDTYTHELIHLRFPAVKHGLQMRRAVSRFRRTVCRLLHVRCLPYPKPDRMPGG